MLSIFSCAYWPSVCFLLRNFCLVLLPIFQLGCFLLLSCMSSYILKIKALLIPLFANIWNGVEKTKKKKIKKDLGLSNSKTGNQKITKPSFEKSEEKNIVHFSSVQSLNQVQLFATPWTTAHQTSLSHHQHLELTQTHLH